MAAELGYWPASTDEEHVARLRAQDARYNEQEAQDPGATKRQKMMGAWVTQVKKSSVQECAGVKRPPLGQVWPSEARSCRARRGGPAHRRPTAGPRNGRLGRTGDRCRRSSEGAKQ
jgi:hypothetical protein